MEPVTHALASLSLGRAGLNRVTRFATPMLLVSGLAADLDWLSYWGGPRAFLAGHRTAGHSLVGSVAIAASTAAVFACFARGASHGDRQTGRVPDAKADGGVSFGTARWGGGAVPFRFWRALAVCGAGAGSHLVLDLTNSYGVKLCWPFSARWYAWDLARPIDPWLLSLLLAAVLLPLLLGVVAREISGRANLQGAQDGPGVMVALLLVVLYFGGLAVLHHRAWVLLNSRLYRGDTALRLAAFPGWSPLAWLGVVDLQDAYEEVVVPVYPATAFDPEAARHLFKPAESPGIENARRTASAQAFLSFARFPFATEAETSRGYEIQIIDLRFDLRSAGPAGTRDAADWGEVVAVIELNPQWEVTGDALRFAATTTSWPAR